MVMWREEEAASEARCEGKMIDEGGNKGIQKSDKRTGSRVLALLFIALEVLRN